jgi:hypothetical protein
MRITKLIIPAIIASLAIPAVAARPGAWETIGQRRIGFGADSDVIAVRGNARHRAVRLCAVGREFKLLDADVYFANGGEQDIAESRTIRAGTCTNAVDLRGNRRDIVKVKLFYSRFNRGRAPIVRVMAR